MLQIPNPSIIGSHFRVVRNELIRLSSLIISWDSYGVKLRWTKSLTTSQYFGFDNIIGHFLKLIGTLIWDCDTLHLNSCCPLPSTPNHAIFAPRAFFSSMKMVYIMTDFLMNIRYFHWFWENSCKAYGICFSFNYRKYSYQLQLDFFWQPSILDYENVHPFCIEFFYTYWMLTNLSWRFFFFWLNCRYTRNPKP